MNGMFENLKQTDIEIYNSMKRELVRQQRNIELIASENIVSMAVMETMGSHLTNKYAEGYSGNRYYGGCTHIDEVENLAIERLKKIFGAEHANVQPHSGANANIAVYFAVLKPGDKVKKDYGAFCQSSWGYVELDGPELRSLMQMVKVQEEEGVKEISFLLL